MCVFVVSVCMCVCVCICTCMFQCVCVCHVAMEDRNGCGNRAMTKCGCDDRQLTGMGVSVVKPAGVVSVGVVAECGCGFSGRLGGVGAFAGVGRYAHIS